MKPSHPKQYCTPVHALMTMRFPDVEADFDQFTQLRMYAARPR